MTTFYCVYAQVTPRHNGECNLHEFNKERADILASVWQAQARRHGYPHYLYTVIPMTVEDVHDIPYSLTPKQIREKLAK